MKTYFRISVYILTDSTGEWWETLKKDGSVSRFERGTSLQRDKEFKTAKAALNHGKRNYKRFRVEQLDPPGLMPNKLEWKQTIVHDITI